MQSQEITNKILKLFKNSHDVWAEFDYYSEGIWSDPIREKEIDNEIIKIEESLYSYEKEYPEEYKSAYDLFGKEE